MFFDIHGKGTKNIEGEFKKMGTTFFDASDSNFIVGKSLKPTWNDSSPHSFVNQKHHVALFIDDLKKYFEKPKLDLQ